MDLSKQKLLLRLAVLLMLIGIILAYIPNLIDSSFFQWLESKLSYKLLLNLWMLTTLILLYKLSLQKLSSSYKNELNDKLKNDRDDNNLMENLSTPEKLKLRMFLNESRKVIWTKYDSDIKVLCRNGILKCLNHNSISPSEIMVEDWAWEWINNNKSKIYG